MSLPNPLVILGQTYQSLTIPVGELVEIYQGGIASAFDDQGGLIEVFSGGVASDTFVESGGVVSVASGGAFSGGYLSFSGVFLATTISSGGIVSGGGLMVNNVADYGLISGLTLSNAFVSVYAGGVGAGLTLGQGGDLALQSGGVALDLTVASGGYAIVSQGGLVSGALVANNLTVKGGGEVIGAQVVSSGMVTVSTGGSVMSSVVSNGGALVLQDTDQVSGVTVSSGGVLDLSLDVAYLTSLTVAPSPSSGSTTVDGATVLAGGAIVYGSATVAGTVVLPTGALASAVVVQGPGTLEGAGTVVGVTRQYHGADPNQVDGVISGITLGAAFDPGGLTILNYAQGTSNGSAFDIDVRYGSLTVNPGTLLSGAVIDTDGSLIVSQGGIAQGVSLEHGAIIELPAVSATSVQLAGSQLEVFSGGIVVETIGLAGDVSALQLTTSVVLGAYHVYSTFISATQATVRADLEADGVSDILIENTAGAVVAGQVGVGLQESYLRIAGLGPEWSILGVGDFQGGAAPDFLMERTGGALVIGALAGGQTTYTQIGVLSPASTFEAVLDNLGGGGQSGFIVKAPGGALQLGAMIRGSLEYTPLGGLGPEWKFVGAGDFLGDGQPQFLIQNTNGAVVVGEIDYPYTSPINAPQVPLDAFDATSVAYARVAALGLEWSIVETGDFLGDGKTDFLMENTSGAVVAGEVGSSGQANYTTLGGLGPEWSFVGAGDYTGVGRDGFLIENSAGALVIGLMTNGHLSYTSVGGLGPEWKFHG
jgi:autotransporter passenger strand-loop-strand repeat protein